MPVRHLEMLMPQMTVRLLRAMGLAALDQSGFPDGDALPKSTGREFPASGAHRRFRV
jgi:hypothetical protein